MKTTNKKQQNILEPYEKKWVALSADGKRVVAAASTMKSVDKKLDALNEKNAVLTFVLPFNKSYSP